ncbi:MAG TPA: hypothetical protein PLF84_14255 [Bryobacteraceae bacterium]|nr:hypothetical protein [Bryobacterales bacterium]HRJ20207.1 hypothetical protein [Bryobacteraceae bacterium]
MKPESRLIAVKLLHTFVWVFFVTCIAGIPAAAALGEFRWAAILAALVAVECAVIALNRGRCPLTDIAGRYTPQRQDNFDIYLPLWLARYNKQIFGTLYIAGALCALAAFLLSGRG